MTLRLVNTAISVRISAAICETARRFASFCGLCLAVAGFAVGRSLIVEPARQRRLPCCRLCAGDEGAGGADPARRNRRHGCLLPLAGVCSYRQLQAKRARRLMPPVFLLAALFMFVFPGLAHAHAVAEGDKGYIQEITGVHIPAFIYLGAKHMLTGYDHILFLLGVIFFLYRMKDIAIYVTLFAIGHSTTMLAGVFFNFGINSYIIA
jgi:hypothetical protein